VIATSPAHWRADCCLTTSDKHWSYCWVLLSDKVSIAPLPSYTSYIIHLPNVLKVLWITVYVPLKTMVNLKSLLSRNKQGSSNTAVLWNTISAIKSCNPLDYVTLIKTKGSECFLRLRLSSVTNKRFSSKHLAFVKRNITNHLNLLSSTRKREVKAGWRLVDENGCLKFWVVAKKYKPVWF
jgi:hypothetical protein